MKGADYWDDFLAMIAGGIIGLGFTFYGSSQPQLTMKSIGAFGGGVFGTAAIFYSKKTRDREFYISCVEETDRQIFIESCNQTLEEFITPPPPEQPPQTPIITPALPIGGVSVESPEQIYKRCECPKDDPKLKQLWDYLSVNHPAIIMLLERQVLLVFGEQGSGKTTFIAFLILLRHLYLDHRLVICDPHAHQNTEKWLAGACDVFGGQYDYGAIGRQIDAYFERLKAEHIGTPITSVWDEFTNYDERLPDGDKGFVKSALSDARKSDEYIILVGHGDTNGALGGSKGTAKMRNRGITKILLLAEPDARGKVHPQMRGTITGLFKDDKAEPLTTPLDISEWMNPQYLLAVFPQLNGANTANTKALINPLNDSPGNGETPQADSESHQPHHHLESLLHQQSGANTTSPLPDDWAYIDVDLWDGVDGAVAIIRGAVTACIRAGWSQNKTIEAVFGITKSGKSARYDKARNIYQEIKALYGR